MQVNLADFIRDTPEGEEARAILRACVHCGFCTATCPTYQVLGDERDGPRGRIYLIKQALEGVAPGRSTQQHLDRCLGCSGCETTCPSGVQYTRLLDIGRTVVDERVPRPLHSRALRALVRTVCTGPLFGALLAVGRVLRPGLSAALREKIPPRAPAGAWPRRRHARRMLLLAGCVQPAMAPNISAATARVLDALGVELIVPPAAGCCGAIRAHLGDPSGALRDARRNIDAWWPYVEDGIEAIVMNASGCGARVHEYAHALRHDAAYAAKAARVATLVRDLAQLLPPMLPALQSRLRALPPQRLVFHPPCTLQHALQVRGAVEPMLRALGAQVLAFEDSHQCCGSAGTYSLLQPKLSHELRERKLRALTAASPETILSANVGCIAHLAARAPVPVRHWIEWLDARLDYAGLR
ncbi:MAG TPA: glycolate oxidase subunit GlcF [Steroidobacteraceae bacterium]|nr:glycolate oxidase subunit GlcF [Steroidobacteraceae bacterium]